MSNRQKRFVITIRPRQIGVGTYYIARDGGPTAFRSKAARFHFAAAAQYFARLCNITFIDPLSIAQEEFTEFELQVPSLPWS